MTMKVRYMIVTPMKNEGPYILDWVAHHMSLGFDHLKWSGKFRQRAKMYPALTTGYGNDEKTQFFGQV